jgi:hypothetical protein
MDARSSRQCLLGSAYTGFVIARPLPPAEALMWAGTRGRFQPPQVDPD